MYGIQDDNIFGNPLFENGPVVIFLWKNDSGWSVQNVTQNVCKMFGYTADEFKNGSIIYADIIDERDLPKVYSEVEVASKTL